MEYVSGILFSIVAGIVLGLESETRASSKIEEKSKLGGIRTYTILSIVGAIAGIFSDKEMPAFSLLLFFSIFCMIIVAYFYNIKVRQAFGLTTEVAVIMTFTIGFFATSMIIPVQLNIVFLVVLLLFLSSKEAINKLIKNIEHSEVVDFIQFALVALVILPFLPNQNIFLSDVLLWLQIDGIHISEAFSNFLIFNPYAIWFTVVLISGFDLFGYVSTKFFGEKRGLYLAGFFSGIVSSTSATVAFAKKSKSEPASSKLLAGSVMLANGASFLLLFAMMLVANYEFGIKALPILLTFFVVSMVYGTILFLQSSGQSTKGFKPKHTPYSVVPAIKFVFLIVLVSIGVQLLQMANTSDELIIFVTALSGLVGVNAPVVATATLFGSGIFTLETAVIAFFLINVVNFVGKVIYAFIFGEKKFSTNIAFAMLALFMLSLAVLVSTLTSL